MECPNKRNQKDHKTCILFSNRKQQLITWTLHLIKNAHLVVQAKVSDK